jgi:nucleotide-binding universal stress UspA family protein
MIEMNRILCPVDFSPFSERALRYAMGMGKWYGAALRVLHVMPPLPPSESSELAAASRALTARNLKAAVDRAGFAGVNIDTEIVESADVAACILQSAERWNADLIVTGSHGRTGVQRVLLGSVVETLLHRSGRPVLTVPSHVDAPHTEGSIRLRNIICAVDFAEASLQAAAQALAMAEEADARLTLLHVIEMPPEIRHARGAEHYGYDADRVRAQAEAEALNKLRALVPLDARDFCAVETAVLEGGAARQILRLAAEQDADLIVLGVHGRNVFDLAFFGSNSKDIIRQAHCPVLVVPAGRRSTLRAAS